MGRKLTALWDERELGNSVMLLLASVVVAVLPNVPYRLNAQLGILLIFNLEHSPLTDCTWQLHYEFYALRFISGLRAIKMIKEQIQLQS